MEATLALEVRETRKYETGAREEKRRADEGEVTGRRRGGRTEERWQDDKR
jgi:hypothetical protein